MTGDWEVQVFQPIERHMLTDNVGDFIVSRDMWRELGAPGSMGVFELDGQRWMVGRMQAYGPDRERLQLRVRRI